MAQNNAGIKYTQLPPAAALTGAEVVCLVQGGISKQATLSAAAAVPAGSGYLLAVAPAGTTNNWAPTGFTVAIRTLDVDTTAGAATLTGLLAGADGQDLVIANRGPNTLILNKLDAGSLAANQFRNLVNLGILSNTAAKIRYVAGVVNQWLVVS